MVKLFAGRASYLAAALVLSAALLPQAEAIDASQPFADLEHVVFRPRSGAPGNIVSAVQTRDGFLWLGTTSGLFRFDGVTFRRYVAPQGRDLPDNDITVLAAAPSGGLWAATRFGRAYFIDGQTLRVFGAEDGLPAHTIGCAQVDDAGQVWMGSMSGTFRLEGSRWKPIPRSDGTPASIRGHDCLKLDGSGNLWALDSHQAFLLKPDGRSFMPVVSTAGPQGVLLDPARHPWILQESGLFSLPDERAGVTQAQLKSLDGAAGRPMYVYFLDSSGMAWGLVGSEYFRLPASWVTAPVDVHRPRVSLQRLNPLENANVESSNFPNWFEDQEGDVWVTSDAGLDRFRSTKFRRATAGLESFAAASITTSKSGTLWVESEGGLFKREPGGEFVKTNLGPSPSCASCVLLATRDGRLYRARDDGIEMLGDDGYRVSTSLETFRPGVAIQAFAEGSDGDLWVSASGGGGVFVQHEGRWSRRDGTAGMPPGPALSMAAAGGRMWLGYPGNIVAIAGASDVRVIDATSGLSVGNVLVMAPQGEHAWIGGSNGLFYFDGQRMHAVANARGVAWTGVSGMVITPEGDLWLNDSAGVQRLPARALEAWIRDPEHARVEGDFFDIHAGVEGSPVRFHPLPTATRTPDGRLWFATSNGLYWIDPSHIARNRLPPRTFILGVQAGGTSFPGPAFDLPARTSSIEIDYTSPLLGVPDLARFRYRLYGIDSDWQDAGARRQAFYTNLRPGSYRFQVMAQNEDGLWSDAAAETTIVITPAFWQTAWFEALTAFAATALLAATWIIGYRVRVRRLERALRLEAGIQQVERERIARDLHDTLLQNIYAFLWRVDLIARRFAPEDRNRQELDVALERAQKMLDDGRARVLNPEQTGLGDEQGMVDALRKLGERWSNDTGIGFSVAASGDRVVRDSVRSSFAKILSEAIVNAFRHSGATSVSLAIRFDDAVLDARVTDDGVGIPPDLMQVGSKGHIGLGLMSDRARTLGARLHIRSMPNEGTVVHLSLVAKKAYPSVNTWRLLRGAILRRKRASALQRQHRA